MTSSSYVDTNLLRNAVRMVHCIQKERGSSCAYYSDNKSFEYAMMEARMKTDIAAGLIQQKDLPIVRSICKIRDFIAKNQNREYSQDNTVLHRIMLCFSTLISSVIHECILQPVGRQEKTTIKNRHKRGLSYDINDKLSSEVLITPEMISHKTDMNTKPATPTHVVSNRRIQGSSDSDDDDNERDEGHEPPPPPPPPPITVSSNSARLESALRTKSTQSTLLDTVAPSPAKKVNFASSIQKVHELLDLLHIFVQLKESAGLERAILSSILAHKDKDASFRILTNDLIMQVENQRSLVAQLENLPDGQHRNIVLDLAQLSPQLKDLHNLILMDFDSLRSDEYDLTTLWEIITLYIDKLHSVELLIIEELECAQPLPLKRVSSTGSLLGFSTTTSAGRATSNALESGDGEVQVVEEKAATASLLRHVFPSSSGKELVSFLKSKPGDEIKERLLAALLREEEYSDLEDSDHAQQDSDHAQQVSAATSLNEGLNNVLNNKITDEPNSKEWEVSIYEIKFTRRLGQGASATTYLGSWTGQEVAVKVASTTQFGLEGWRTEVAALQRLHHPNIIRLMGSIYHKNPLTYCLVLEYCNAGDLNTALKYPTPRNFFFHVSISIANAMAYLHNRGIIHRDLKPKNVLCHGNVASGNFAVKVTDFGVATEALIPGSDKNDSGIPGQSRNLTGETGTYRWMAPEVVRHEAYSTKADVYSFAIMVWQFITHEEPFWEECASEAARIVAIEKKRPPIPQGTPPAIAEFIKVNWSDNADERWKFDTITESLQKLQTSINAVEKAFLEEPHGHPVYVYEDPNVEDENDKKIDDKNNGRNASRNEDIAPKRGSLLSHFFGNNRKTGKR